MKGYLIVSWNPWDCEDIYLKVFTDKKEAHKFITKYALTSKVRDEELELHEVEVGQ